MKQKMAATSSGEPAAAAGDNAIRALSALFISARPAQWVKNLVLPLPFLFGGALGDRARLEPRGGRLPRLLRRHERDLPGQRRHGPRAGRGASGQASPAARVGRAAPLDRRCGGGRSSGRAGSRAAFLLDPRFGQWCALYAAVMTAYSLWLKRVPFLEALIVAAGLPLRALAGAALADLPAVALPDGVRVPAGALPRRRQAPVGAPARRPRVVGRAPAGPRRLPRRGARLPVRALCALDGRRLHRLQRAARSRSRCTAGGASRRRFLSSSSGSRATCASSIGGAEEEIRRRPCSSTIRWLLLIVLGWVVTAGVIIYGR